VLLFRCLNFLNRRHGETLAIRVQIEASIGSAAVLRNTKRPLDQRRAFSATNESPTTAYEATMIC
jgi:hypothetical protein